MDRRGASDESSMACEERLDSMPAQHSFGLLFNTLVAADFLSDTMDVRLPRAQSPPALLGSPRRLLHMQLLLQLQLTLPRVA